MRNFALAALVGTRFFQLLLWTSTTAVASGPHWQKSTVAPHGGYSSTDIVEGGYVFVSYSDGNTVRVKKSINFGQTFIQDVCVASSCSLQGSETHIYAVDANHVFVCYYVGQYQLWFAASSNGGLTWHINKQVDSSNFGAFSSITAADSQNVFILARWGKQSTSVRMYWSPNGGVDWGWYHVQSKNAATYSSIKALSPTHLVACYNVENGTNDAIEFAETFNGGATWSIQEIDVGTAGLGVGDFCSLAAADPQSICVAYDEHVAEGPLYAAVHRLKFARRTSSGWTKQYLNQPGDGALNASLEACDASRLVVSYARLATLDLNYLASSDQGAAWTGGTVAAGVGGGYATADALADGRYAVVYRDSLDAGLKIATGFPGAYFNSQFPGCPDGSGIVPQLTLFGTPAPAGIIDLFVEGPPNGSGFLWVYFGGAPSAVPILGSPCLLFVTPTVFLIGPVVLSANGKASITGLTFPVGTPAGLPVGIRALVGSSAFGAIGVSGAIDFLTQ